MIIITKSRKDLVRKQKACINEVNKRDHRDPKNKEVFQDFSRWSKESKVFNDERGRKHIISYEGKVKANAEEKKGKKE